MPFGVTNAPATFQRMMNALFKEELDAYVIVYLDAILIFSQTLEDHIHHIKQALQKLRDAQLFARLHKCSFFQKKVEYLGFNVSGDGGTKPGESSYCCGMVSASRSERRQKFLGAG